MIVAAAAPSIALAQTMGNYGGSYGYPNYGFSQYALPFMNSGYGYQNYGYNPVTNIGYSYQMPIYQNLSQNFLQPNYYQNYSYPSYQNSYPNYGYGYPQYGNQYRQPAVSFSTGNAYSFDPTRQAFPSFGQQSYGHGPTRPTYIGYSPFASAYPTGDYDLAGTSLCRWSDYNGRAPCSFDPQQWVYDPYTGQWY